MTNLAELLRGGAALVRQVRPGLLLAACLLALPAAARAQAPAPRLPDWAQRYYAAERRGQRFAHVWLGRAARPARVPAAAGPGGPLAALVAPGTPYSLRGTFRMAVIAATYADHAPAVPTTALDALFFAPSGPGGRYSLAQYYREASLGKFTIAGTVTPWLALPKTRAQYGRSQLPFVYDAIVAADQGIDWRQYDNDGPDGRPDSGDDDGFVDLVTVLHPLADGVCRSDGGPISTGWRVSNSPTFGNQPYVTHSVGASGQRLKIEDFVLTASVHCSGSGVTTANIAAHEMGHALGLPDLYDLDHSSYGVGYWDLMGYGTHLADGRPGLMSAFTRAQLGWVDVVRVTQPGTLVIPPAETTAVAYRIDLPGTSEYLLLENRQRLGADAALPGSGLLVWHVDGSVLSASLPRYAANENDARPGITLLQGDGRRDLLTRANLGDAGDPLPGAAGIVTVGAATSPAIRTWQGTPQDVRLSDIGVQNGVVRVTVSMGSGEPSRERVLADLMRRNTLWASERARLDSLGNRDGGFDLGDVLAYLGRTGAPASLAAAR